MNFINDEIKIDFAVSQEIREFMNAAERLIAIYRCFARNVIMIRAISKE